MREVTLMRRLSGVTLAVVILGSHVSPGVAQDDTWQNKWYWGAQAGAYIYSTPSQSSQAALEVGAHWLITARQVGLYIGLDQVFFGSTATSAIADASATGGLRTVDFTSGRRVQAELYAFPMSGTLQVYGGGGFAVNMVTDALPQGTFASSQQEQAALRQLDAVTTKAFFVLSGGAQWRMGRWAVFATYHLMPEAREFLISSEQHVIRGGIRYALTAASQDVTTAR